MPEIIVLALVIGGIFLAVLAILMPIFVLMISDKVAKIDRTLTKMEHMMRHGKD